MWLVELGRIVFFGAIGLITVLAALVGALWLLAWVMSKLPTPRAGSDATFVQRISASFLRGIRGQPMLPSQPRRRSPRARRTTPRT